MAGFHTSLENSIQDGQAVSFPPQSPGLYVHIPFCLSRCGYCAFASGVYDAELADMYLGAAEAELRMRRTFADGVAPSTVFIGGGTPSCLSPGQLERLLGFLPKSDGEATCEMNPDSVDEEKLRLLRDWGINRISFGVQTFSESGLRFLGRRHDRETALRAVDMAQSMGFHSISVDLLNGWPEQSENELHEDISIVVNLGIQHLSYYNFILEPEASGYPIFSCLASGSEDEDERGERYWKIIEESVENNGFTHYETSNFSLPGFQCDHNVRIWRGGDYLGVGVAACSHLRNRRHGNYRDTELYIKCIKNRDNAEEYSEVLGGKEKARECAVFWLRLFEGVDVAAFQALTGYDFFSLYSDVLPGLFEKGFMERAGGYVRVAKGCHLVLDGILVDLV